MAEGNQGVRKKNIRPHPLRLLIDSPAASPVSRKERFSPSPGYGVSMLRSPSSANLTRCHSTSLIYSDKFSRESGSMSPSLSRRIFKISQSKPQNAFQDVRTVRVADANGFFQKFSNIQKSLKPEEDMIKTLKLMTKNKHSVNTTLGNLFYNQIKKREVDLDSKTIMDYTLKEASQKVYFQERQRYLKKNLRDRLSKSPTEDLSVDKGFPKRVKIITRKQEKGEQLQSLKNYSMTQKETLAAWHTAQEKGRDIKKIILNGFFEKNSTAQMALESHKYKKPKASKLIW